MCKHPCEQQVICVKCKKVLCVQDAKGCCTMEGRYLTEGGSICVTCHDSLSAKERTQLLWIKDER